MLTAIRSQFGDTCTGKLIADALAEHGEITIDGFTARLDNGKVALTMHGQTRTYGQPLYAAVAVRYRHHSAAGSRIGEGDPTEEMSYCIHCGQDMYQGRMTGEWRTTYVDSADPRQCFIRNGEDVEPVNNGHEAAAQFAETC